MWNLDESFDTSAGRVAAGRFGSGPPLVLAHGWPWSSFSWHRIIPALSQHFSLYWYDMPGFGQSDLTGPRPASLDTQGDVFGEMLNHFGITKPYVLAHDFGGATTLRAHLLNGVEFDGYLLMNVVAMRPWGSAFFDHVQKHIDAFTGLPPHIHKGLVDAYIKGALVRDLPDGDAQQLASPWYSADGQAAFYAQFGLADERFTAEVEPHYGDIRCPVHVIWGADDPWIPQERGQAFAQAVGTTLRPLDGLGHLPQLEAPDRVIEQVFQSFGRMC